LVVKALKGSFMIWVKVKPETLASNNKRKHKSDSDDEDNNEEERPIVEEIIESVDEEYEGEVAVSQILFLAVHGFNVSDYLGFLKSQIPENTCQIECSRPKSCPVPLALYVTVASVRHSNCGNVLKPHLPSTEPEMDGSESTVCPS
jgi:hypothetical protein